MENGTETNGGTKRARGMTVQVKPAMTTPQPEIAEVNEIEVLTIEITVLGKSQLIGNNFGPKGAQHMEDERARTQEEKLEDKKKGKPPITLEEIERRFQAARLLDSEGRDCVRSQWIKCALITASKYPDVGIASTKLRGAVYVEGDLLPITYKPRPASASDEVITYWGTSKKPGVRDGDTRPTPGMRRDIVRVGRFGAKQPDIRYRPAYDDWSVTFQITFEPKLISMGALHHLIRRAGMSIGLCEWRPEGPGGGKGGQFGRFDLKGVST
jgi:hypothetical protein